MGLYLRGSSSHLFTTLVSLCVVTMVSSKKLNVLFLVADDMRPEFGFLNQSDMPSPVHPRMHTPHIDALAARSLVLANAYVQQAVCSPSRTSLLTGRRPDTTKVHDFLHYFREEGGNFTTIPQYFKEHGYVSVGMGKVFHPGHSSGYDDPISWSEKYFHADASYWSKYPHVSWMVANETEVSAHPLEDMQLADHAIDTLRRLGPQSQKQDQPFFIAVGFHRPHLPFVVPESFFKLYPPEDVSLPPNPHAPIDMPEIAWAYNAELRQYQDFQDHKWYGGINSSLSDDVDRDLRRAYYAATSYTDSLIGRVLSELDRLGLRDSTIVSFWGDHGWQLGEHGAWCKCTNFEIANRAPMMVSVPGLTDKGALTHQLTEFVDLFPSLAELAGLPPVPLCPVHSSDVKVCTEGVSFVPLIHNTTRPWKTAVFSQFPRMYIDGNVIMGYSMRTERYRYAEWLNYDGPRYTPTTNAHSLELYDHHDDPQENENRIFQGRYKEDRTRLHNMLQAGWRAAMPHV